MALRSVKKAKLPLYHDVLAGKPREYYDYESLRVQWGKIDDYEVTKKIGRGKYSEVFLGFHIPSDKTCVIKVLKPVKKKKIKREIKILRNVARGPNIVDLLDVVRDPLTKTPCLVFEHVNNTDWKSLYPSLTLDDIRYYVKEILRALDFAHSAGICHRDVKPQNIMIDHDHRKVRLIDWGLAEFYHPLVELNVRVASRHYKGPELLVDDRLYEYSLDIWSMGCVLAGMIFKKEPFFAGADNADQLFKISRALGTADLQKYLDTYDLDMDSETSKLMEGQDCPKKDWSAFTNESNKERVCPEVIDLIDRMLRYDPAERILPKDAMQHPFLNKA